MAKKRTNRPKASPKKAVKKKSSNGDSNPQADEEFSEQEQKEYYTGPDWVEIKKKHPRGLEAKTVDLKKIFWNKEETEWSWFFELEGHEKLCRINDEAGRTLADGFGRDMNSWKDKTVYLTPRKWTTGWGVEIEPVLDDDAEENDADENDVEIDDDDDID